MDRDQGEEFVAVDLADKGVRGLPAAEVIGTVFDEVNGAVAAIEEVCSGGEGREASSGGCGFGGLPLSGAIEATGYEQFLAARVEGGGA